MLKQNYCLNVLGSLRLICLILSILLVTMTLTVATHSTHLKLVVSKHHIDFVNNVITIIKIIFHTEKKCLDNS